MGVGLMSRFFFPRTIALAAFAVAMIVFCGEALAGAPLIRPGSGSSSANASSWVAGGHAGYNWQQGAAVYGFATDLQATQLRTSVNAPLTYPTGGIILPTDLANTTSLVDWYGTLRGQLGVASGPWLLYGTAGLAYGHASLNTLYRTAGLSLTGQISDVKTGWTAGAGFKYMMLPNLSVGFQYLYVDLGSLGLAGSTSAGPVSIAFNSNANNRFQTATVGLSWHFLPGSTAAPWQGAFAGIHGGGAWGNDTNATYTGTSAQGL
jgi:outer membrane immunogenic protein